MQYNSLTFYKSGQNPKSGHNFDQSRVSARSAKMARFQPTRSFLEKC